MEGDTGSQYGCYPSQNHPGGEWGPNPYPKIVPSKKLGWIGQPTKNEKLSTLKIHISVCLRRRELTLPKGPQHAVDEPLVKNALTGHPI